MKQNVVCCVAKKAKRRFKCPIAAVQCAVDKILYKRNILALVGRKIGAVKRSHVTELLRRALTSIPISVGSVLMAAFSTFGSQRNSRRMGKLL
jgi:hypothetical protein